MSCTMNPHLRLLLSEAYTGALHPEHQADLDKSGITAATTEAHKLRSVPVAMIPPLLGFAAPSVRHAYIIPFPAPAGGGFLDYVKLKIFGTAEAADLRGAQIEEHRERFRYNRGARKYLVRRQASPHLYIPIPTMRQALEGDEALWICEGMKKALAMGQLELPTIGIESAWGWHLKGSRDLLPDFDAVALRGRVVKVVPDPDAETTEEVGRAMRRFAAALDRRGARVLFVTLPSEQVAA